MSKVNGMLVKDINTVLAQKIIQEKSALSTKILNYTIINLPCQTVPAFPLYILFKYYTNYLLLD